MRTIYKRLISIVCAALMIISILVLPANAQNYSLVCSEEEQNLGGAYRCYLCDNHFGHMFFDEEIYYDTLIQDSYYIPEDNTEVIRIQEIFDSYCKYAVEQYDYFVDMEFKIYFRTFRGNVLNALYTGGTEDIFYIYPDTVHRLLSSCREVYYSHSYRQVIRNQTDEGVFEEIEETEIDSGRDWINPVNDKLTRDGYCSGIEDFLKDPEGMLTSTEATKHFADDIEIAHTFYFIDGYTNLVYCVTNHGDYIYIVRDYDSEGTPRFVFPVDTFKSMLREMPYRYADTYKKGYLVREKVIEDLQSAGSTRILINYFTKEEIVPYVVGGEEALEKMGIHVCGEYIYVPDASSTNPTEDSLDSDNIEDENGLPENDGNVFTVLFVAETALFVIGATAALITVFIRRAKKKKKDLVLNEDN